jgi:formylglycine-generating enzyme required for sulfatase activity
MNLCDFAMEYEMIFISYSHVDRQIAIEIHDECAAIGVECWRDERCIRTGDDFAVEITRTIRECEAFMLLLSHGSISSDYVNKEVAIAHHFRKIIIPVLLDNIQLSDEILPYVIRCHYWDLRARPARELATDLKARFGSTRECKPQTLDASLSNKGDVTFVTNEEYLAFARTSRRERPLNWSSWNKPFSTSEAQNPVTGVSWSDAIAYCDWAGGCLPISPGRSMAEGDDFIPDSSCTYEWLDGGNERFKHIWDPHACNVVAVMTKESRSIRVGFRCMPVKDSGPMKWVNFKQNNCYLGTNIQKFERLAAAYRLFSDVTRPILNRPLRKHIIHEFEISSTCITNQEYYKFTQHSGRPWPPHWNAAWIESFQHPFPKRMASQPVVNVTAEQARTYCIWSRTRLPIWEEWQYAAGGYASYPYPWGSVYDDKRCNSIESERGSLACVNDYPLGDNSGGVKQLCGNVWEWTIGPGGIFEVRGGSFKIPCELWGLAYVFRNTEQGFLAPDVSFRVLH